MSGCIFGGRERQWPGRKDGPWSSLVAKSLHYTPSRVFLLLARIRLFSLAVLTYHPKITYVSTSSIILIDLNGRVQRDHNIAVQYRTKKDVLLCHSSYIMIRRIEMEIAHPIRTQQPQNKSSLFGVYPASSEFLFPFRSIDHP